MRPVTRLTSPSSVDKRKEKIIKVRVSNEEWITVKEIADKTGKSLSSYMRDVVLGSPTVAVKNSQRWGALGILGNEFIELKESLQKNLEEHPDSISSLNIRKAIEQSEKVLQEIKALREELL